MEILDKVGDAINVVLGGAERFITGLFGSSNERRVKAIGFARESAGDAAGARREYLEALRLDPANARARERLAALDRAGGR